VTEQGKKTSTVASPAAAATVALPSTLRLGVARTRVELKQFFRSKDSTIFMFLFPVLMLMIFATVFSRQGDVGPGIPGGPISFGQYFLPGMVATGVMLTSFQSLAIQIPVERDDGALKRLRGTPMPSASYFLGKVGQVLVASVAQLALLLVVARVLFAIPLPTAPGAWLTFLWVFVLGTACGSVLGVAFSSVPSSGRSASAVVVPIVLVLQFISGVYFMYSDLPTWLQRVAEVFPLKWMAQGMRSVFFPDAFKAIEVRNSWEHPMTVVVLASWLVLGLVVGIRTFRWSRRGDN